MRMADRHLIDKCLNGDSAAFGMLVDRYKESVYALAYSRLRNFHDAEDITQEAFTKAYQKLRTLRRWDEFYSWIYAITSNLCKNLIKARARRPDREFIEDHHASLFHFSVQSPDENSTLEVLHEALDSLPESYQQVLTLHYLGGMDCKEMAQVLGKSPSAIWQSLSRARASLKKEMLDMMSETYEQNKLRAGFTLRIVEIIKRIRIEPVPPRVWPLGFSVSAGLIIGMLCIGMSFNLTKTEPYESISSLSGRSMVREVGEIPIDMVEVSDISVTSDTEFPGDGLGNAVPDLQNTLFMAPQAEGGTWAKKADMPTGRLALSVSEVKGKIYAIGGWNGQFLGTVEEYDPKTNTWLRKSDMPTARGYFGISVVNDKIYAIGGSTGPIPADFCSIVEEYDPVTDVWAKKADMPTNRYALSTVALNGKIYAIGGSSDGINPLSAVEEYDPEKDKWIKKANMPIIRESASASVVDGKIYLIGGSSINGPQKRIDEYDPAKDEWTLKGNMSGLRIFLSSSVVNGKIYIIGGIFRGNPLSTVEEYDPIADKLVTKANMPTSRGYLSACAVNNKIYVIGGSGNAGNTVEEYDIGMPDQSINLKGKLPNTWGEVRTASAK